MSIPRSTTTPRVFSDQQPLLLWNCCCSLLWSVPTEIATARGKQKPVLPKAHRRPHSMCRVRSLPPRPAVEENTWQMRRRIKAKSIAWSAILGIHLVCKVRLKWTFWANNERQCHTFTDLHEVRWASPEHDFGPRKVPHCSLNASSSDYKANIWAFKAVSSWLKTHWTLNLYGKLALQLEAFQQSILWSQNSWKKQRPMGMASGPMGIAWLHLAG